MQHQQPMIVVDSGDSDEEEYYEYPVYHDELGTGDDYSPVLPLRTALSALGYISAPSSRGSPPPHAPPGLYVTPSPAGDLALPPAPRYSNAAASANVSGGGHSNHSHSAGGTPPRSKTMPVPSTPVATTPSATGFEGNAYAVSLGMASPYSTVGSLHPSAAGVPQPSAPIAVPTYLSSVGALTPYASNAPNLPVGMSPYGGSQFHLHSQQSHYPYPQQTPYAQSVALAGSVYAPTPASVHSHLPAASPYTGNPMNLYPAAAGVGGVATQGWTAAAYGPY